MRRDLVCALAAPLAVAARAANPHRIMPLADAGVVVSRSPRPQTTYCYTPGICRLASGRLVVTCDWGGPDVEKSGESPGHVYLSDDGDLTRRGVIPSAGWRRTSCSCRTPTRSGSTRRGARSTSSCARTPPGLATSRWTRSWSGRTA